MKSFKNNPLKRVQSNVEAQELLLNLSEENLTKFIIKYIYNDKLSNNCLGKMRSKKWRRMKTKEVKSLARVGPDDDSNIQRNKRVIYHTNVLLNFQEILQHHLILQLMTTLLLMDFAYRLCILSRHYLMR